MAKIIRFIGFAALGCLILLTVIGLIISYAHRGAVGSSRSFGLPELMMIGIIGLPSLGLIIASRWLEKKPEDPSGQVS